MYKLFISYLFVVALCMITGCSPSGSSSNGSSPSSMEATDDSSVEALAAAQNFVRLEFASDAIFQEEGTIIEPTSEPNRFKVLQRFDSKDRDGYNFVYRIWVQKFPTGWEFGNLGIERAGGERVLTTNGRMKEMEREEMTHKETSSAGDVDFTIVKHKAPNFVLVYTEKRLNRDDVLTIYDKLKDEYESVRFTTSPNPDDDDYLAIQGSMVFEYDKDKITKFADF